MRCICGKEVDDRLSVCPYCSRRLKAEVHQKQTRSYVNTPAAAIVTAAVVLAAAIALVVALCGEKSGSDNLFSGGMTPVYSDELWGYVDTTGREKIAAQYSFAYGFAENGLAAVVTEDGEHYGYINTSGKMILGPYDYDESRAIGFFTDDGLAFMRDDGGKYGFINKKGEWEIEPANTEVRGFSNGIAAVKIGSAWGYIDTQGMVICEFKYDDAGNFAPDGLAAVKLDGKWGYIDTSGELVIDAVYYDAYDFSNGLAAVKRTSKWEYINTGGETVIETDASSVRDFAENGLAAFCKNGLWGYINKKGKTVIDAQFEDAGKFSAAGYAAVETSAGMGIINSKGALVTDNKYKSIAVYDDGYAVVSENGMTYGILKCSDKREICTGYAFISYDRTYNYLNFDRYVKY